MMDLLSTVGGGAGTLSAGAVIFLLNKIVGMKEAFDLKHDTLKGAFDDYKVKVAEQYVMKSALNELEERIDKRFDKLEAMLRDR